MTDPEIESLTSAEEEWIAENLETAAELAKIAGPDELGMPPDPVVLDAIFSDWLGQWLATKKRKREDPNPIISCLGIALGASLVGRYGMEWGIYADSQGTDLAVHKDSFTTFPISSVAKRVEEEETGWFEVFVDWVGERLAEDGRL